MQSGTTATHVFKLAASRTKATQLLHHESQHDSTFQPDLARPAHQSTAKQLEQKTLALTYRSIAQKASTSSLTTGALRLQMHWH